MAGGQIGGSQNLRRFRIARRDGASLEDAAEIAGMTIGEARIHAKRDDENPPPEEAFRLIGHNPKETVMVSDFKKEVGDRLEEIFPGQVQRDVTIGKPQRMAREPEANGGDDRLRHLIERVERLEEERKGISDDIRDVFAEAKAVGYDVKILRKVLKLRKMSADDRREMDLLLQTYCGAIGLQLDLPLAVAA